MNEYLESKPGIARKGYATTYAGEIYTFDTMTGSPPTLDLLTHMDFIAFATLPSHDGRYLYLIGGDGENELTFFYAYDLILNKIVAQVSVKRSHTYQSLQWKKAILSKNGKFIYLGNETGELYELNTDINIWSLRLLNHTKKVTRTFAIDSSGSNLYIGIGNAYEDGSIEKYDLTTNETSSVTDTVAGAPMGMASLMGSDDSIYFYTAYGVTPIVYTIKKYEVSKNKLTILASYTSEPVVKNKKLHSQIFSDTPVFNFNSGILYLGVRHEFSYFIDTRKENGDINAIQALAEGSTLAMSITPDYKYIYLLFDNSEGDEGYDGHITTIDTTNNTVSNETPTNIGRMVANLGSHFIGPNIIVPGEAVEISSPDSLTILGFTGSFINFNGGTLKIKENALTINQDISLLEQGGVFDTDVETTVTGIIHGDGGLTKLGSNILILTGQNVHTGTTTIQAGTLILGKDSQQETNSTLSSLVHIQENGQFGGIGTVAKLEVEMGASVIPGNIGCVGGTLEVESDITFNITSGAKPESDTLPQGSIWKVQIDPEQCSTIKVNGTVLFENNGKLTLDIKVTGRLEDYQNGKTYTLLTANKDFVGPGDYNVNLNLDPSIDPSSIEATVNDADKHHIYLTIEKKKEGEKRADKKIIKKDEVKEKTRKGTKKEAVKEETKSKITKEPITIRLSPDVLAQFRATGKGWQARVDAALQQFLAEHPLTRK